MSVAEDAGNAVFTVTLSGDVAGGFTVDYATSDVSATAGSDYTATSGTLTFAGTDLETQIITVPITDDVLVEATETYTVTLSNVVSVGTVTISDATGLGTITDNDTPPVITSCAGDKTISADASCQAAIPDLTGEVVATDDGVIVSITQSPVAGTIVSTGVHTVTITVTDDDANVTTCTADVDVIDDTAPIASCQNITIFLDISGNASIDSSDVDNGSSDNCAIATITLDISNFTCADIGDNMVTMTVTDVSGNASTCNATVTVVDNIPPTITCPADVAANAAAGDCSVAVNGIGPATVGDNCSGTVQVSYRLEGATTGSGVDDASGMSFNKGVTTVWYKVTDQNGNADSCSFEVNVSTTVVPPASASSDPADVCPGDGNITLSYSGGVMPEGGMAMWYDDAGLTNNIGNGNDLNIPAPVVTSTYYVRFEGSCDTSSSVSTTVTVKTMTIDPTSANVDRSNVCAGDGSITLSYIGGDLGSNGTAVWYEDAALTSIVGTGNNLSIAAPTTTTTYWVRFEADCDISAAVSVDVTVWPLPVPVFVEGAANVCINGPLYKYVAGGMAGSVFNWNITNGSIVNDYGDSILVDWGNQVVTGILELTETSVNGCVSDPVTMEVEVGGPELDLGQDVSTCMGTALTIDPGGDFATYLWQDGSTGPEYTTDQEGWISLQVTDPYGCTASDSVYMTVHELPEVDLGPDTTVCGDEGIILDAGTDGIYYNWSTGETGQEITVFMGGPEEIRVEVENEFGCISGDTIIVESCSVEFYLRDIPTAITPGDGNGLNDYWEIDKLAEFSKAVVEIYDRWGTLVWRSEPGYSNPWDGRNMNGEEVPMDSYHFVIELNTPAKKDFITGIITVIR